MSGLRLVPEALLKPDGTRARPVSVSTAWDLRSFRYNHYQYTGTLMLRALPSQELVGADLVPQAIVNKPISFFHDELGIEFTPDYDDLDEFEGAFLTFNEEWAFALRQYQGHPPDKTTIYLSREIDNVATISKIIQEIVHELGLPTNALHWQRSDNPEL